MENPLAPEGQRANTNQMQFLLTLPLASKSRLLDCDEIQNILAPGHFDLFSQCKWIGPDGFDYRNSFSLNGGECFLPRILWA
jgi:hypothetical protein